MPFALHTYVDVNNVDRIAFTDSADRAFRFASPAGNALFSDLHRHG